jgi:UDP:flavonoid glycosyltransferase YjiC (YdhE family)
MGLKPGKGWLIKMRDQFLARMMNAKFNEYKPKLNKIRDQLHLPPLENTLDIFHSADFRIIQTLRTFDTPILPPPVNVRYSGPILDDPDWAATKQWNAPWDQSDRRPLVVISFSSTFQNQAPVIQKSIDALKGLHVKGLVTLGMAMENEDFNIPDNVFVMNTARHSEVFPHADVVITHAGHGTVIRALAHGVPLICLPLGRDQNDNAIKVEMKGCGIKLSPGAKVSAISKAVGKILTDADFKLNAGKLKEELSRSDGFDALLTEIEQYSLQHKKHIKDTETVK